MSVAVSSQAMIHIPDLGEKYSAKLGRCRARACLLLLAFAAFAIQTSSSPYPDSGTSHPQARVSTLPLSSLPSSHPHPSSPFFAVDEHRYDKGCTYCYRCHLGLFRRTTRTFGLAPSAAFHSTHQHPSYGLAFFHFCSDMQRPGR